MKREYRRNKRVASAEQQPKGSEQSRFDDAMNQILKADPKRIAEDMHREKRERAEKRLAKRDASSPSSGVRD